MKSIKTLFPLLLLLLFSYSLQSQDSVLEQRIENMVKRLDKKVQLSDKQEKDILTNLIKDWLPLLEEYQNFSDDTAKSEKDKMMNSISAKKEEIINEFLTENQKKLNSQ